MQSGKVGVGRVGVGCVGGAGKEADFLSSRFYKIFINSFYCKLHIKFCDRAVTKSTSTLCAIIEFLKGTAYHIALESADKPTGGEQSNAQAGSYDSRSRDSARIYYTCISTVGYSLFRGQSEENIVGVQEGG